MLWADAAPVRPRLGLTAARVSSPHRVALGESLGTQKSHCAPHCRRCRRERNAPSAFRSRPFALTTSSPPRASIVVSVTPVCAYIDLPVRFVANPQLARSRSIRCRTTRF